MLKLGSVVKRVEGMNQYAARSHTSNMSLVVRLSGYNTNFSQISTPDHQYNKITNYRIIGEIKNWLPFFLFNNLSLFYALVLFNKL